MNDWTYARFHGFYYLSRVGQEHEAYVDWDPKTRKWVGWSDVDTRGPMTSTQRIAAGPHWDTPQEAAAYALVMLAAQGGAA